jgi:acyl carrier protein
VARVITEVTGLTVESHADLAAAGVDSMQMLEILAALEDEFGIGVSENMIREFRTIDRIVRIIKDMVGVSER